MRLDFTRDQPLIPIVVEYKGKISEATFLIDTGADLTLLSSELADRLGMSYDGEVVKIRGIAGSDLFYAKEVNIWVKSFECPFSVKVYISRSNDSNILGRDVLFKHFGVYMDKDKIILESLRHCSMTH